MILGEQNEAELKIHFIWLIWKIKYRLELRKRIKDASEEKKELMAKHLGVENPFLLKRQINPGFRNLVFSKIIENPRLYREIIGELTKLLSETIIDKEEIDELIAQDMPRTETYYENYPSDIIKETMSTNNIYDIKFLRKRFLEYTQAREIEKATVVGTELYQRTSNTFSIGPYFSKSQTSPGTKSPKKYDSIRNSNTILHLNHYRMYFQFTDVKRHLAEALDILGWSISLKIIDLIFNTFDIEKSIDAFLYYKPLINNFLTIASLIYFNTLSLEEKLSLLNNKYNIKDFSDLVINSKHKLEPLNWITFISELYNHQYHNLALNVANHFQNTEFTNLKDDLKANFYTLLGSIYRNLKNYELALEAFRNASKYVSTTPTPISSLNLKLNEKNIKISFSIKFGREICSMYIGECYFFLDQKEQMQQMFQEVIETANKLEDKNDQFHLYLNLSIVYRTINDFTSERTILNKASDLLNEQTKDSGINYIEERILAFERTAMNRQKLIEIGNIELANELIKLGEQSYKCFNFMESTEFFKKALDILEEFPNNNLLFIILKDMGFSYLRMEEWSKAKVSFEKANNIKKDFELKLYLFLCQYHLDKKMQYPQLLQEICIDFRENEHFYNSFFKNWILDMVSAFRFEKFKKFISFLEIQEYDDKWNLIYNIGWILADFGFSEFSIELFKKEISLIQDTKLQAKYYNNIGTVYFDIDNYELALENFNKAIQLDKYSHYYCRNIAQTYFSMIDLTRAVKLLQRALSIAQQQESPPEIIEGYKQELRLMQRLQGKTLLIDRTTDEKVRIFLRSAEKMAFDYLRGNPPPDVSVILVEYSKALETMLHLKVSILFAPLIAKYKNKDFSVDCRKKFGVLKKGLSISPGTWVRIIDDFSKEPKESDVREFRNILTKNFTKDTLDVIKKACVFMALERNPISHTEMRDMNYVLHRRKEMIRLINRVIEKLYE